MSDLEYVKRIGQLYNAVMSLRNDDDYVVNKPQMDKFVEVLEFFMNVAQKNNGKVDPVELSPKEEHGGITATFRIFDIYGDDIQKFCRAMSYASAIGIYDVKDGVCISVTIPNVFVKK